MSTQKDKSLDNKNSSQTISADKRSTVANVAQSHISGNVIDSIVAVAGGNVIIHYNNGHQEHFEKSTIYKQYLETIVALDRFNRWADEQYIDETVRPLPMNLAPYDVYSATSQGGPKFDLIDVIGKGFERGQHSLILGEPGAGKTTALERLTYMHAHQGVENTNNILPILVPLNRYDGNIYEIIQGVLNGIGGLELDEDHTKMLVSNLKALILFDGLNELGDRRANGVRAIENFMNIYPHHLYVLTCRTQDYRNDIEVKEVWEIQPLGDDDIKHYLEVQLGNEGKKLYSQLRSNNRLLDLARNSLLLQMIKKAGLNGKLPRNRGELYLSFVKQMLWREGKKGDKAHRIPGNIKQGILARLGYEMQQDNVLYYQESQVKNCFVRYLEEWYEQYNWRDLLEEIRLNGLLQPLGSRWSFIHQSLQEFFAAYEIEDRGLSGDVLDNIIGKPEWNEVILLLAGITDQSTKLIKYLLTQGPFMAAKSLSQVSDPDSDLFQMVITQLGEMSKDENWSIKRACADLLGEIGLPSAYPYLMNLLKDDNLEVRWGADMPCA